MNVILMEDVEKLGKAGDVVKVADGFARNFLIPKGKAMAATTRNVKELEHKKRLVESRNKKALKGAQSIADKLETLQITIPAKVGEDEKLFGSVTRRNISDALAKEGVEIERKNILLEEAIKTTGVFNVDVKVHKDVKAKLRVWVVAE